MSDVFSDAQEQRLADELDAAIDAALAGRSVSADRVVERLTALHREAAPPARPSHRPAPLHLRRPRAARIPQYAALFLGITVANHAFGNLFLGQWVADLIDGPYDPHTYREGALALAGVAAVLFAGALNARWLSIAALAGGPVGLALGIHGGGEIVSAPLGGVLHLTEGIAGMVLLISWWRYARRRQPEGEP